jgi:YfiH family protein
VTTTISISRATTTSTSRRSSSSATARAQHRTTSRADGDLCIDLDADVLAARRKAVVDLPWTWLRQVHGADVVRVDAPGACAGARADAAVTTVRGAALAVHAADCAPVVLRAEGVVGVAHVGWRGLVAGVVGATSDALRALGAADISVVVAACIGPECYEFGLDGLGRISSLFGERVRSTTTGGSPSLDLRAAVTAAAVAAGIRADAIEVDPTCTACGTRDGLPMYSHRARRERERHATVAWLP